jgi:N-hydroxyarylamine O-acetyltransferase
LLEALVRGEWLSLCRFDRHPQQSIDFEAANFQLAHDPASRFVQGLVVSRVAPDGRHTLRDRELAFCSLDGKTTRRALTDATELLGVLHDVFGIRTTDLDDLPARWNRLGL